MNLAMNRKRSNGLGRLALRRSPSILAGLLLVQFAQAAPEDLTLPCPGAMTHSFEVDDGSALNADVVSDAGDSVFWSVTLGTGVMDGNPFECTQSPPDPAAIESFSCPNGVSVSLPAGAPAAAVGPAEPVLVDATPASGGEGYVSFALTATLESDPLQTCTRNFTVDVQPAAEPFDLVWVLDRSGSMAGSSNIIGDVSSRWEALEEGAGQFLPFIADAGGDAPGSNFGLTLFAGSVLTDPLGGMIPIDGAFSSTVQTALNQTPSGSTAMGSGLQDAMSKMTDATRPRIIMLFTDGEQNRNPRVAIDGCGFTNPASPINPACPATSGYKIVTVGIGNPSGDYKTTLEQLAANNRGKALVTNNGETFGGPDGLGNIVDTFEAAIQPLLSGLSPQQVAAYQGGLAAPATLQGFDVNRQVDDVMLSVSLNRRMERPNLLRVLSGIRIERDGSDVTSLFEPVIIGTFTSTAVLWADFDDAGTNPAGQYLVSLAPQPRMKTLRFRLAAFVDDHRLDITSNVSPTVRRVNQPIEIQVELAWLTAGIEGADVEVSVLAPETDLGQALSDDPTVVDPASGPDAGSPGQQKYDQLVADDPAFLEQLRLAGTAVPMSDEGGGIYRGSFTPSSVSDVYQVLYDVRASDPLFGDIQRRWVESIYVRFGAIDMDASNASAQIAGDRVVLDFFPMRVEGLALGPGQGSAFAVSGMDLVSVEDHQTGRYTLTLEGGDPGAPADTPIEITLLGDPVYAGPAGEFAGTNGGGGLDMLPWWVWLILLLLLIVAVLLVRRRASGTP